MRCAAGAPAQSSTAAQQQRSSRLTTLPKLVQGSPFNSDTALSLYELEHFELFWEKTLVRGVLRTARPSMHASKAAWQRPGRLLVRRCVFVCLCWLCALCSTAPRVGPHYTGQ